MSKIHPTALISDHATIAGDVEIGAYAVIGPKVSIAQGCKIGAHTCIDGTTEIGPGNRIGRFAAIGADPQDLGYKGEETCLKIGENNFFGDYTQACRGTAKSHDKTTHIGSNNYFMAYTHIAHDCLIQDHVIIANAVQLGGHVEIEDHVYIGGIVAIHQFVRIGRHSMVSGGSAASLDIPPFVRAAGYGSSVYGLNAVGLKRSGEFSADQLKTIKTLFNRFFRGSQQFDELLDGLEADYPDDANVQHFTKFVRDSKRGVVRIREPK